MSLLQYYDTDIKILIFFSIFTYDINEDDIPKDTKFIIFQDKFGIDGYNKEIK